MSINVKYIKEENLIYLNEDKLKISMREMINKTHEIMKLTDLNKNTKIIFDRTSVDNNKSQEINNVINDLDEYIIDHSLKSVTICGCKKSKKDYNFHYYKNGKLNTNKAFTNDEKDKAKKFLKLKNNNLF